MQACKSKNSNMHYVGRGGGGGGGGGGATPKSAPADKLPVLYLAFIFVADFVVESVVSFFARGLRGMKRALSSKDRGRVVYNILLIGETGSGKTSF